MGKRATMKDIASRVGLSINAVSLALNNKNGVANETRLKILKTAEELGYFSSDRSRSAYAGRNICVLTRREYCWESTFYSKVLYGVEQEAKKMGYDININFMTDNGEIPACVIQGRVCGIILIGRAGDKCLHDLMPFRLPMVLVDHASLSESVDSIMTDNKLGEYKMTRLLVEKGFSRIGFFGDLNYSISAKERFFGFEEGLRLLPFLRSYGDVFDYARRYSIVEDTEKYVISHDVQRIRERLESLPALPEALVCYNDETAIQVIRALGHMGLRVPEEISVAGFDDIDYATICIPKLTTVRVHKESMGKAAVQKLLWRMDHRDKPSEITVLSVDPIERDSVGVPCRRAGLQAATGGSA